VRVAGQNDDRGIDAPGFEIVELSDQNFGIDDATGTDHGDLPRDHSAWCRADLERLLADDDCVPGVRPTLVAADHIRALRK
jgi:hypothetical protein